MVKCEGQSGRKEDDSMVRKYIVPVLVGMTLLTACNNEGTEPSVKETDKAKTTLPAPPIEEADIPEEEKTALLAVFQQHIDAFNAEDVERYMDTISKKPLSFDYDEEKVYVQNVFDDYDITLNPQHVTIIEYTNNKASIFAEMHTVTKDDAGNEIEDVARQVTMFRKDDGEWKIVTTFAMDAGENK
jgi:ketosteroid isomerase-like protein